MLQCLLLHFRMSCASYTNVLVSPQRNCNSLISVISRWRLGASWHIGLPQNLLALIPLQCVLLSRDTKRPNDSYLSLVHLHPYLYMKELIRTELFLLQRSPKSRLVNLKLLHHRHWFQQWARSLLSIFLCFSWRNGRLGMYYPIQASHYIFSSLPPLSPCASHLPQDCAIETFDFFQLGLFKRVFSNFRETFDHVYTIWLSLG